MILTRSVAGPLPYFSDGHGSARDECASRILTGPKDSVSVRIEIGCGRGHGSNVRPESPGKGLGSKAAVGFTRTLGKSELCIIAGTRKHMADKTGDQGAKNRRVEGRRKICGQKNYRY
jgi:hypothetical protein